MRNNHHWQMEIELHHILLEVQSERFYYLSSFLQSYYCYQRDLVTKTGLANPIDILSFAPRSVGAKQQKKRTDCCAILLLPLSAIKGELTTLARDECVTFAHVEAVLQRFLHYMVVSKAEFRQLQRMGGLDRLPKVAYQSDQIDYYAGAKARLEQVNIEWDSEIEQLLESL